MISQALLQQPPDPSPSSSETALPCIQIIIRLDNVKSYVLNFTPNLLSFTKQNVLNKLSDATGLPSHMLKLSYNKNGIFTSPTPTINNNSNFQQYFLSASTHLPIRGGKGGFGTLLKGQSKQAGAKRTLDFGACRDLNGRRLRHVNDEIKLRKWRDSMRKKMEKAQSGGKGGDGSGNYDGGIDIEEELEELRTASGIRNWHLMVPNWSDVGGGGLSGKSRRAMERSLRREIEKIANESRQEVEARRKKKADWEDAVVNYAYAGERYMKDQEKKMTDSIIEGMKKRKKRKLNEGKIASSQAKAVIINAATGSTASSNDESEEIDTILAASNICTLSGDVVLEEKSNSMLIQSKSEFATFAVLLNSSLFKDMADEQEGLYYEAIVKTCGIAQIGWATLSMNDGSIKGFLPNSDTGDGVGDDSFSYGFDGSRGLAFHAGKSTKYGNFKSKEDEHPIQWQEGDVIGCIYNVKKGQIEYSINGESSGIAFEVEQKEKKKLLHPVLSLNQSEIIELNTGPDFQFAPKNYVGVSSIVGSDTPSECNSSEKNEKKELEPIKQDESTKSKAALPVEKAVEIEEGPIRLDGFNSASELEKLGGDKLKKELFRLGCKCGGPVQERAKRLFLTKGLKRDEYPKKILHPHAKI